ncbi:MAG: exonuclease domain-containing protein [Eubacteriales bacterium]|nr:exonuclease domain-containing protein [Eubacteriales bacterium]
MPNREELALKSFVAVDFETANRSPLSACQIALVRFENSKPIEDFVSFIKPPQAYGHFEFTYLHGISEPDVAQAPTWLDLADKLTSLIGDCPVYAHNASFDSRVWAAVDKYYFKNSLPRRFYCSCNLARQFLPGLYNYKLPTVLAHCDPSFNLHHHRADSDAMACGIIVSKIQELNR